MTTTKSNTFLAVIRLPLALALLLFANTSPALASDGPLPELSLSVLQFGTAHWELDQVQHRGLDRANGYRLVVHPLANLSASRLAVASGSVDGAVADLLWVQHRYRDGQSYFYVPFSSQIGDVVVPENSDIHGVADLSGRRIGVAGGPDSKGWILLKAVAERQGVKLGGRDQVQYGSPPLLNQALKRGQVDAIVTYWHFAARLRGQGVGARLSGCPTCLKPSTWIRTCRYWVMCFLKAGPVSTPSWWRTLPVPSDWPVPSWRPTPTNGNGYAP
ncbi:ABC transporter substrate-binding protein [Marinobacter koreensis]|uniref:ABC transporter substrate-binding protein n=1 Tax=Marinobacter koreensis TaxID=335974 RepID=UPI00361BE6F2